MLKKLSKDILLYGLASTMSKMVSILLVPFYTAFFSVEEYGQLDLALTILGFVTILGILQLESAVTREYFAQKDIFKRKKMISTALWSIIFFSVVVFSILFIFSKQIVSFLNIGIDSNLLMLIGVVIPFSNISSLFTVLMRFKNKPLHYLLFQAVLVITVITSTIYFVKELQIGIAGVLYGQLIGLILLSVLMSFYLRNELLWYWNSTYLKKMLGYSLPIVPNVAGNWLNSSVSRFFIVGFLSVAEVGIYALALKIGSLLIIIGGAFKMAWDPFFWNILENKKDHKIIIRAFQKIIIAVSLILVLLISAFSKELLKLVATEEYFMAVDYIGFIAFAIALNIIISPTVGIGPSIIRKTGYNTLIFFTSLIVNILMLFLTVKNFGIFGVVFSLLISSVVRLLLSWYNSEKLYRIGFDKFHSFWLLLLTLTLISFFTFYDVSLMIRFSFVFLAIGLILYKTSYNNNNLIKLVLIKVNR